MPTIKSGISHIDRFLGGFQPGDNVVWTCQAGTSIHVFIQAFLHAAQGNDKCAVVYVNSNYAPQTIYRRFAEPLSGTRFIHLDAFTFGKGKGDTVFRDYYQDSAQHEGFESICIGRPSDVKDFNKALAGIEEQYEARARYVFDSLTGLSELWGGERHVQEFFTYQCPKLYELQAVAYWVLEREAHSRVFMAHVSHITQVVIQLQNLEEGVCETRLLKAEDRPSRVLHEAMRYRVDEDKVYFIDRMSERNLRIGERIREVRMAQNLSQTELARMLDITPSALCQIESNQVHPSLPLLVDLAHVLGKSVDSFFQVRSGETSGTAGCLVHRKKDQPVQRDCKGARGQTVEAVPLLPADGRPNRISPFWLRLEVDAEGTRSFLDHKGPEFGWVLSGILKLAVKEKEFILRKGDSIYLEDQTLKSWRNEGTTRCELVWVLV